jgi:formamidopyrimidine-DNA glycosylase
MPELPEVETVRRGLEPKLRGRRVTKVTVLRPASIGHPTPNDFVKSLQGREFGDIERRGKYLLFKLDKGAQLGAHLRMSGRLLVFKPGQKQTVREEHVRVRIELDNGHVFVFEDMRVFGRLWFIPAKTPAEKIVTGLADLGVEPLSDEFDADYLQSVLKTKSQPIKGALLDQTLIAGIGNIYADESLHLAGINPQRPAKELKRAQIEALVARVKEVLARAIEKRGSTLRNYTDSDGVNGNYQSTAYVYGREGSGCHQCSTAIVRVKLSGRSAHFCPKCQPAPRKRS